MHVKSSVMNYKRLKQVVTFVQELYYNNGFKTVKPILDVYKFNCLVNFTASEIIIHLKIISYSEVRFYKLKISS